MTDPAAAPRVTATEGNPRVVLLTLPDEIVSETVRDAR